MNKDPKFSAELHKLCGKLREGEITDAEAKRLNDLLLESKAARRFYRAFMALTSALETRVAPQDVVDPAHDSDTNIDVLFERLQEAEDNAEPDFSLLHTPVLQPSSPKADPGSLSSHDLAAVTGYALRLALTSKPAKRIYAYAGVAAVVLLAVTLINPWGGGEEHTPDPVADDTSEQPAGVLRVATLTAEHDAVWASDAPSTGDTLAPGQRLTLTAGFAEITTEEGAIAILEAPVTIELIGSPNTIRLHAGKLVGICETETSKGFLVRTPHTDVIDLGTRFGVHVEDAFSQPTHVQVFQGSVRLESLASEMATLFAGQAKAAGAEGLIDAEFDETRYVQAGTGRVELAALAANPFGIANPSFEWVALEDGMLLRKEVPGWALSDPTAAVVANPGQDATRYYDPALALDVNGGTVGDMHGRCLFFFSIDQPDASISQTLAVQAEVGTTYTLTVAIGDRMEQAIYRPGFAGYNIELLAGDQVLASLNASPQQSPGKGTFTDVALTYTVQPDDPSGLLGIRLSTNRANKNQVTDFDNIRLTASRITDGTGAE